MSHVDDIAEALATSQWSDESSDDETKSYASDTSEFDSDDDDDDENPTSPDYLPIFEDQLESNPGDDDYPRSALLHPFPQPNDFQLVNALQIAPKCHYLFFDKDDTNKMGFYWFSKIEGGEYFVYNGTEEIPLSIPVVDELLQHHYFFQISFQADFDHDVAVHKAEDLIANKSYLVIPHAHPERKKLMVFKGCTGDGSCKWVWSWQSKSVNISIPKTIMPAIFQTSWVFQPIQQPLEAGVTFASVAGFPPQLESVSF